MSFKLYLYEHDSVSLRAGLSSTSRRLQKSKLTLQPVKKLNATESNW